MKNLAFALLFAFSLAADQLSKMWARAALKASHRIIEVIPGYWEFRYSENEGSAFGLFRGMPGAKYVLFVVGIVALVVVFNFLRKLKDDRIRVAMELGLLAGGAVGNIVDRVLFSRVTDFILWKVGTHEWPIFNVADAALVVGVIGLLIDLRDEKKATGESAEGKDEAATNTQKKRR